ncbi:MAG: hypothetical protein U0893_24175 [Chloroflexota bacterium]
MARSRRTKAGGRSVQIGPAQNVATGRSTHLNGASSTPARSSPDRSRQMQRTMTGGALGGGALLAGFGVIPALVGAAAGATLGYLFERSVTTTRTNRPA